MIDGFKPTQRKILHCALKRKLKSDIKVAQLAGYISEHAAYHHGEVSLEGAIVNMAQDYVGSNNLKLLVPSGQFGTRLEGGKDSAASRYIYTRLNNPVTRAVFHPHDDPLYTYLNEEGKWIEPKIFVPVIPMILVNGAEGIGTGWSTKIPNHDPRDIVENCRLYIDKYMRKKEKAPDLNPLKPWYRGFTGEVSGKEGARSFQTFGVVSESDEPGEEDVLVITELPIAKWTSSFKEHLLKLSKDPVSGIVDFREYHTDVTVEFRVKLTAQALEEAEEAGYEEWFGLKSSLAVSNMMAFDKDGKIKLYKDNSSVFMEFCPLRAELYAKRKDYQLRKLKQEELRLQNQRRFVQMVVGKKLLLKKRKIAAIIADLVKAEFVTMSTLKSMVSVGEREEDEGDGKDDAEAGDDDDDDADDAGDGGGRRRRGGSREKRKRATRTSTTCSGCPCRR